MTLPIYLANSMHLLEESVLNVQERQPIKWTLSQLTSFSIGLARFRYYSINRNPVFSYLSGEIKFSLLYCTSLSFAVRSKNILREFKEHSPAQLACQRSYSTALLIDYFVLFVLRTNQCTASCCL